MKKGDNMSEINKRESEESLVKNKAKAILRLIDEETRNEEKNNEEIWLRNLEEIIKARFLCPICLAVNPFLNTSHKPNYEKTLGKSKEMNQKDRKSINPEISYECSSCNKSIPSSKLPK